MVMRRNSSKLAVFMMVLAVMEDDSARTTKDGGSQWLELVHAAEAVKGEG